MAGEIFVVEGRTAFVILPKTAADDGPVPWVWYAPTLPNLPNAAEKWMFERFLAKGIAVAGVDVGESFGNPQGRAVYSALHRKLVKERGFAEKACLLARSRGGLMLYNWAAENPDSVAGIAGIYPVCNILSWPRSLPHRAFGLRADEFSRQVARHNPVDRLESLARAQVPIFHIHGDVDQTVPLEANSGELRKRYEKLGGQMTLQIPAGQGHNMWPGFFQCQKLVDFVIQNASGASLESR